MPGALALRSAIPGDAAAIVRLVRQAFRADDLAFTIYGCSGIEEYLRCEFSLPPAFSPSAYLVAAAEDGIAGFVDLRQAGDGLFLNYIVIASEWQGRGLAAGLLHRAIARFGAAPGCGLLLDVFEHNQPARGWYQRRGFHALHRFAHWRVAAAPDTAAAIIRIRGLAHAEAAHRVFGFSRFELLCAGRPFSIGRLGDRWFQVTDGELLRQAEALAALRSLDPHREVLFRGPESAVDAATCSPLLWSIRMTGSIP